MFDFGLQESDNQENQNPAATAGSGAQGSQKISHDDESSQGEISIKHLIDGSVSIKKILQNPKGGSIISAIKGKKDKQRS